MDLFRGRSAQSTELSTQGQPLMKASSWKEVAKSLALPSVLLTLWEMAVSLGWWPNTIIASPVETIARLLEMATTKWPRETTIPQSILLHHALQSLGRLMAGFLAGSTGAIWLGIVCGVHQSSERAIAPTVRLLAPVPPIAWTPILIVVLGIGEIQKISLIAIGTFFVVFFYTFRGIRAVDGGLVELAKVHHKSQFELLRQVLLPGGAAMMFGGLRLALGLGWILLVAAEIIASADGLGWLMQDARNFSRPADMIAAIITVGTLGALSDRLLGMLERQVIFWNRSFEGL